MLKHILFLLTAYCLLILETTPLDRLLPAHAQPKFLWVGLVIAAVLFRGPASVVWSGLIGLLFDCIAQQPLGVGVVSATLVGYAAQRALPERRRPSVFPVALAMFLIVFCVLLMNDALRLVVLRADLRTIQSFAQTAFSAGITACWGLAVHLLLLAGLHLVPCVRRPTESFSRMSHRASVH